jgi:ABC-type sugar transport system substrate-binding protein/tRNA A-37 threonylcarbamoyl transferase component Bud32
MDPYVGKKVGQYELRSLIGQGGMAVVYRANQSGMNRDVAVKIVSRLLTQDPLFRQRFEREVTMVAQLEHANIVPVFEHGDTEDGTTYLAMRYIKGGSLADQLKNGPLPLTQIRDWLRQIASALDYAHAQKIIHRDIKPANILLDEQRSAYLVDFGLARMVDMEDDRKHKTENLTKTGSFIGTPAYMSPEQINQEKLDARSDVYSLAVVLYEMVTGVLPFQADSAFRVMQAHLIDLPTPPGKYRPDLSVEIEQILYKALEKDPVNRFQSAGALYEAFAQAVDTQSTTIRVPRTAKPPAATNMGRWAVIGLIVLAVILVIGGGVVVANTLSQTTKVAVISRPETGTIDDLKLTDADIKFASQAFKGSFLGMVACLLDTDYHATLAASVRARAQELGIPVQVADAKSDPLTQSRLISQFVAQGAKALVVCPLDDNAIKNALQNAQQAGVLAAETGPGVPPGGVSISGIPDQDMGNTVGKYTAKLVNSELGGKAVVAILGYPDLPNLVDRANAMKTALLADAPNVTVLVPDAIQNANGTTLPPASAWKAGTAEFGQASMTQILAEHPDVNVIMSINDAGAFGAVTALKIAGKGPKDVMIISVDADPNAVQMIKAGEYFRGSVTTSPVPVARMAVDAVVKLLAGDVIPLHIPMTAQMITKDNVDSLLSATAAATTPATAAPAK